MFWILSDYTNNVKESLLVPSVINNNYTYYQIFPEFEKHSINENFIYNFESSNLNTNNIIKSIEDNYGNNFITIYCDIKIKDSIIQYSYIINNKEFIRTFIFYDYFVEENNKNNILNLPYIKYNYTKIESTKMPNLIDKEYDFYYKQIKICIYKISESTLFIKQTKQDNTINKFIIKINITNTDLL